MSEVDFDPSQRSVCFAPLPELGGSFNDLCQRIREAAELGNLRLARTLVAEGLRDHPDEQELRAWERAVQPATVRPSPSRGSDRTQEVAWLRAHASEHRGRWVAVDGDQLLAEAPEMTSVLNDLQARFAGRSPLLEWIP